MIKGPRKCRCVVAPDGISQFAPFDGLGDLDLNVATEKYVYFTRISGRNATVRMHETTAKDSIANTELVKLTLDVGLSSDIYPNPQRWLSVTANKHVTFKGDANNKGNVVIDGYVFIDGI